MRYGFPPSAPNRACFLDGLGLGGVEVLGVELAHSRRVLLRDEGGWRIYGESGLEAEGGPGEAAPASGYDGLLVRGPGLAASVTVADCMPIYLLDLSSGAFGVLHSGWKGTGILATAVAALAAEYGSPPAALSAILGPAIGPCCYAVPEERALGFAREFGPEAALFREGRHYLDLGAANRSLAARLGLGALLVAGTCTSCDAELGSCRREGSASFTRMMALAAPPEAGA